MHTFGSPSLQISSETVNFCKEIGKETKQTCSFVQEITILFAVVDVGLGIPWKLLKPNTRGTAFFRNLGRRESYHGRTKKFERRMFSEGMDKDGIIKNTKYKSAEKGVTLLAPHWL